MFETEAVLKGGNTIQTHKRLKRPLFIMAKKNAVYYGKKLKTKQKTAVCYGKTQHTNFRGKLIFRATNQPNLGWLVTRKRDLQQDLNV